VEFALLFPVLILLLFGIVDLGRGVYAYNTIDNAARQGARVATVNQIEESPDCDESRPIEDPADPHWSIKTCAVVAAFSLGVAMSDVDVTYFAPPGNVLLTCSPTLHVGCIAKVTVQYAFRPATPIIGNIVGDVALSSTAEIPVERVFP
jgi:Flp pilus assembly protein TadG